MKTLRFPFHPFLFSIYPVLFLFSHNRAAASVEDLVWPALVALVASFLLWAICSLALRDKLKAGMVVTVPLAFFFSYGRIFGWRRYPGLVWLLALCVCAYFLLRTRRNLQNITSILNVAGLSLLVIVLISIATNDFGSGLEWQAGKDEAEANSPTHGVQESKSRPDIYYIILDSYASSSTLKEKYGYDNSEFIRNLEKKGFYVASQSRCNYGWTCLSLASSLNMDLDYIHKTLSELVKRKPRAVQMPYKMLANTKVEQFLESKGYRCLHFGSGYLPKEVNSGVGEFPVALLKTTMLGPYANYILAGGTRKRITGIYDSIGKLSKDKEPTFVLAHVLPPHWPYVFGPHGEAKGPLEMVQDARSRRDGRYVDQVMFVSKKTEILIDIILANSRVPPIIIIQGDHGPDCHADWENPTKAFYKERMSILNAYYLPDSGAKRLYSSITPVNTFRLIFNQYFNTKYKLLEDASYFSPLQNAYDFVDVTDKVKD
jgi:hypothetical protein